MREKIKFYEVVSKVNLYQIMLEMETKKLHLEVIIIIEQQSVLKYSSLMNV